MFFKKFLISIFTIMVLAMSNASAADNSALDLENTLYIDLKYVSYL